jgi:hypothetical protein
MHNHQQTTIAIVANQHVMMTHQHVEAISITKQEAKW